MSDAVCHIIAAGPCEHLEIDRGADDLVIAIDGGFVHCVAAGIEPDMLVGDMDSLPEQFERLVLCERLELPREKDDTDTLAACMLGLERGYVEFRIYAGLGGDVGHELANMQVLAFLDARGAHGTLLGDDQRVRLVTPRDGLVSFHAPAGTRVSMLAFGGNAKGVRERGLHWGLEDATLMPHLPIGVSNHVESESFEIGVSEGKLLVVIG